MKRSSRSKSIVVESIVYPTKGERRETRRNKHPINLHNAIVSDDLSSIILANKRLLPTIAKSVRQEELLEQLQQYRVIIATGPAGGGKTYIPVADALDRLAAGTINTLIWLRPSIEAGVSLGMLPGKLEDKIDPFFIPIRQAIYKKLGPSFGKRWLAWARQTEKVQFLSTQHLRGMTLENAFVQLDEAQNCTYKELKMVLTRMGEGSQFVFSGDPEQDDLDSGYNRAKTKTGWPEFVSRLAVLKDLVGITRFVNADSVRDPLQAKLLEYI